MEEFVRETKVAGLNVVIDYLWGTPTQAAHAGDRAVAMESGGEPSASRRGRSKRWTDNHTPGRCAPECGPGDQRQWIWECIGGEDIAGDPGVFLARCVRSPETGDSSVAVV